MNVFSDVARLRLARTLLPLLRNEVVSASVAAGIRAEAICRRAAEWELSLVTAPFGIETSAQRRRAQEASDASLLLDASRAVHGRRRPAVHWHEGGSGPALLLLNGWTAGGLLWPDGWVAKLEQSFRVIRIDSRGTGWSRSAPAPFTIGDLADDARDVLRACDVASATILGLSMGGMVAQELAFRHPDRVDRLVLVATMPPSPEQVLPDPEPFLAALRGPSPGQDLGEYFAEMWGRFAAPDFVARHPEVIEELVGQILLRVTPRQQVLNQMRAIASFREANRLWRLEVPTTVVHGTRDRLIPVGNGMRLARLIPHAEYVELPGVGHLVAHEAGRELIEVLSRKVLPWRR